jgi:O-antigen/teichoic acid export membrane protein
LLSPADFGVVSIITSVFVAVALFTDLGFLDFLVRHKRTDESHFRDVIWTIHVKRGVAIFGAVAVTSPLIAWAFEKPIVALPLAVASIIFVFNGLSSLSLMTALRHDKARELSLLELGLQLFQTAGCIILALWWHNAWSIIAAMLLHAALRAFLSYRLFPDSAQRFARDKDIAREFLVFSRYVMMSSALALLIGQSDKIILARAFTLSEFGLYGIALTLASAPVSFAESYISRIVFPICAQTWREAPQNLKRIYYGVRRLPSLLYAFASGGLIGSASLVIALLYDPRYAGAAEFVSLLMIGTALRLPNTAAAQLMIAIGQVRKTVHVTVVRFAWVAVALPAGLILFGPIGVVAAVGLVEIAAMIYCWILLGHFRLLNIKEEVIYVALTVAGAFVGWTVTKLVKQALPYL